MRNKRGPAKSPPPASLPTEPGAEDAWKALTLVLDLVKHAEMKAGLTLASAGAVGGVLYSLIRSVPRASVLFGTTAGFCVLFVIVAASAAGLALIPRVRSEPTNLLHFHHVATRFGIRSDVYMGELSALVTQPDALVSAIAHQVWANARVARQKYRWATLALIALLAALGGLAVTAIVAVVQHL
ncbi:Pycsar system effector family protein [Nonomuraea typhae]|uniref:Pycsar system effector family protein n=1 Tax=Nonomuraea typhae TaxID=2603600 RepID=UPI0012F9956F|nr:Pycsar system effector family protein [Nonomuraea typhae]